MVGAGGSVMAKTRQRIIDTLRGERCQWRGFTRYLVIFAIGNQIVGVVEIRRIKQVAQWHV
ncbi:hypothetical protein D3C72_2190730 [compost metagenome]